MKDKYKLIVVEGSKLTTIGEFSHLGLAQIHAIPYEFTDTIAYIQLDNSIKYVTRNKPTYKPKSGNTNNPFIFGEEVVCGGLYYIPENIHLVGSNYHISNLGSPSSYVKGINNTRSFGVVYLYRYLSNITDVIDLGMEELELINSVRVINYNKSEIVVMYPKFYQIIGTPGTKPMDKSDIMGYSRIYQRTDRKGCDIFITWSKLVCKYNENPLVLVK